MDGQGDTSVHLARAKAGDQASLAWIVERLTPLLLAQARFRLTPRLRALADPADIVQDAWIRALPRLSELTPREGRETPVLLRFMSTTILHLVNNLMRREIRRSELTPVQDGADADSAAATMSGLVTQVSRAQARGTVLACIDQLDDGARELLVLRGIEQQSLQEVASQLGIPANTVAQRWRRALAKLRELLPASIFDEFE